MDDLSNNFPGCKMTNEEIRDVIRKILKIENAYFCYKCYAFLSIDSVPNNAEICKECYQFYCKECSHLFYCPSTVHEINPYKCIQCIECREFYQKSKLK
jgi:hypothetical protein